MAFPAIEHSSPSTFDTIICETEATGKLAQLDDTHALAQLHCKFWLQGMQDVTKKLNESMNEDQDEDADKDGGEGGR